MAARNYGSDSDLESEEQVEWLLGFVEPPRKRTDLLRHRFPSKVGGRPAWLDPLHLPTEEHLTCRVTGKPLDFLLQARHTWCCRWACTGGMRTLAATPMQLRKPSRCSVHCCAKFPGRDRRQANGAAT